VRAVRLPARGPLPDPRQAKLAVFDFLETFYNPRRRHSALQIRSPLAFKAAHHAAIVDDRSEAA